MVDQHQVISIIATAVSECLNESPDQKLGLEQAKQIAKCIVEALTEAGLEHFPLSAKHIRSFGSSWRIRLAERC